MAKNNPCVARPEGASAASTNNIWRKASALLRTTRAASRLTMPIEGRRRLGDGEDEFAARSGGLGGRPRAGEKPQRSNRDQ